MYSLARTRFLRDVILVFLGAMSMHFFSSLFYSIEDLFLPPTVIKTLDSFQDIDVVQHNLDNKALLDPPSFIVNEWSPSKSAQVVDVLTAIPETTIVEHAPGWTVFRNLYMSNGTLFVVSSRPRSDFPELQYLTSTGLSAENTPENIAARMPTSKDMDFITVEEAERRWGSDTSKNRIWSMTGNTWLFNDPPQFLDHYYHFVAELFLGAWAFWNGAFDAVVDTKTWTTSAPPVTRVIFAHSDDQWRDRPGFNSYFLRAAFPSLTVEIQDDWEDRIRSTTLLDRAWHFELVLLADRSAAFKGKLCGNTNQRTASEAYDPLWEKNKLKPGWWEPLRRETLRFAGVEDDILDLGARIEAKAKENDRSKMSGNDKEVISPFQTEKAVITYISRQGARRRLIPENHDQLVYALEELVARKGYELNIIQAERLTKDEQLKIMGRTTVLLGVHGNGLSHLLFLTPSRFTTVIEIFIPHGFAYDYEWTTRAMSSKHFAIWNDTYHTHPNAPSVHYPDGFQGERIPVHGPTVAKLIEDRLDGRIV